MKQLLKKADEVWVSDKEGGFLGFIMLDLGKGRYFVSSSGADHDQTVRKIEDLTKLNNVGMAELADALS